MPKLAKYGLCMVAMLVCLYLIYNHYEYKVVSNNDKMSDNLDYLEQVKKEYDNNEIVFVLEIPNVVKIPIVQTDDNNYYFTHGINKKENALGTPFLDYRNSSISDKKIIVYGHNTISKELAFSSITNYKDKNFFINNPSISIKSGEGVKNYKVFSCFIDEFNSANFALNDYNGMNFYEHISELKDKSMYETDVSVAKNSKVLLLTNCASNECSDEHSKYQYVVAVEED